MHAVFFVRTEQVLSATIVYFYANKLNDREI